MVLWLPVLGKGGIFQAQHVRYPRAAAANSRVKLDSYCENCEGNWAALSTLKIPVFPAAVS